MTKVIIAILLNCFIVTLFISDVKAALKINEIYPKPATGGEYEWVEFYNNASSSADLSNYFFDDDSDFQSDSKSSAIISLSGLLPENSTCYWELSSYLNDSGDQPTLFKNDGSIVDSYSYTITAAGKSHSRIPDGGEWQINVDPTKSTIKCLDLAPTPTPTLIPTPTFTPTSQTTPSPTAEPTLISYNHIYLSEAMAHPPSSENEWVEIYNDNDFSVSLTNWYIDDVENGGSSPKIFSLEIAAKSYGVFELTNSMFNNASDSVRLLDFNKSPKDGFEYSSVTQGKTYGRTSLESDDFCLQEPSKNQPNNSCLNPTPTPQPTPTKIPSPTKIPTPTNLSVTAVTNRLINRTPSVSINRYIDTGASNITPMNRFIGEGEILGVSSGRDNHQNRLLIRSLSFLSFSYSLLAIISLILKIKFAWKKL